jgi:hypothetical protein
MEKVSSEGTDTLTAEAAHERKSMTQASKGKAVGTDPRDTARKAAAWKAVLEAKTAIERDSAFPGGLIVKVSHELSRAANGRVWSLDRSASASNAAQAGGGNEGKYDGEGAGKGEIDAVNVFMDKAPV